MTIIQLNSLCTDNKFLSFLDSSNCTNFFQILSPNYYEKIANKLLISFWICVQYAEFTYWKVRLISQHLHVECHFQIIFRRHQSWIISVFSSLFKQREWSLIFPRALSITKSTLGEIYLWVGMAHLPSTMLPKLTWVTAPGWILCFFVCGLIFQTLALVFIFQLLLNNCMFVEGKNKWALEIVMIKHRATHLQTLTCALFSAPILRFQCMLKSPGEF